MLENFVTNIFNFGVDNLDNYTHFYVLLSMYYLNKACLTLLKCLIIKGLK
jgi:hypothetical protein